MKWLRNNRKSLILTKYLLGSYYWIKCTQSCIVESNSVLGNSCFYESSFHRFWLIIWCCRIISRYKNMVNLPSLIESLRCFYTGRKEDIIHPIYTRCRPKKKSYFTWWDEISVTIDAILRRPWNNHPRKGKKNSEYENEEEEFPQEKSIRNSRVLLSQYHYLAGIFSRIIPFRESYRKG